MNNSFDFFIIIALILALILNDSSTYDTQYYLNSPGKKPGMGCHSFQEIFPIQGSTSGLPHCRQILYLLIHQESRFIYKSHHLKCTSVPFSTSTMLYNHHHYLVPEQFHHSQNKFLYHQVSPHSLLPSSWQQLSTFWLYRACSGLFVQME